MHVASNLEIAKDTDYVSKYQFLSQRKFWLTKQGIIIGKISISTTIVRKICVPAIVYYMHL